LTEFINSKIKPGTFNLPQGLKVFGLFYFKNMDLKTLLKQMDEYIRRTEGKSLIQKLEEDESK